MKTKLLIGILALLINQGCSIGGTEGRRGGVPYVRQGSLNTPLSEMKLGDMEYPFRIMKDVDKDRVPDITEVTGIIYGLEPILYERPPTQDEIKQYRLLTQPK